MSVMSTFIALLLGVLVSNEPSPPDVQALVDQRVAARLTPGLAVGIIDRSGDVEMFFAGVRRHGASEPIDADTVFEIGSISKVFTTLLLARLAADGRLDLQDPVQEYLPPEVVIPLVDGTPITLEHLATHTSGLVRMPANFAPADPENPYADYTVDAMYEFLTAAPPRRAPGGTSEYSNLGMGLLGHALARCEDSTYEALVIDRICMPLEMTDTRCTPDEALRIRSADGHDGVRPVSAWDIPTLAGAGDLNSTLRDLLRFAAANLDGGASALSRTLQQCHQPRVDAARAGSRIGLGWQLSGEGDQCIIWHNGMTGGFASFLGISQSLGRAVVVLANSNDPGGSALGMYLLGALDEPPAVHLLAEPGVLAAHTGTYLLEGQAARLRIAVEHGQLVAQLTGQPAVAIFPSGPDQFSYRAAPARLVFESDEGGRSQRVVLHQNGLALTFDRVTPDPSE